MFWAILSISVIGLGGLLYWQLILAEGAYLGRYVVTLLYNGAAHIYDRIKKFEPKHEHWFLGLPLSRALALLPDPLILDVATGTARLARALYAQPGYRGRMIGLDYARKMLQQATRETQPWKEYITFLWQDASFLPFPEHTFDAVTCLEALEFMPDPDQVLQEMNRVLRPGGIFMITNRIGKDARWLPGRTYPSPDFENKLHAYPLEMIRTQPWQQDYDLIWAIKSGICAPPGLRSLTNILRCPLCQQPLHLQANTYRCPNGHTTPIAADDIIELAKTR